MNDLLCILLRLYEVVLVARIVFSWIRVPSDGVLGGISSLVWSLTEPLLGPLRRLIPPVRMGMVAIDISIMIVFLVIGFILVPAVCSS